MSLLRGAIDRDKEIQLGSVGFYKEKQLKERFPDCQIILFDTDVIPKDYEQGYYTVVDAPKENPEEVDRCSFAEKSKADVQVLDQAKQAAIDLRKHKVEKDAVLAIDASKESGPLQALLKLAQVTHG